MGKFVGCIEGMAEACDVLEYPVVSGNVSLYNETNGEAILPTPAIGGVGLLNNIDNMATIGFKRDGDAILLIGETKGHLGVSEYLSTIHGREDGAPPPVDLTIERRNGDFVRSLIEVGKVDTCHDVSDGGLAIALTEMAMAGKMGAAIEEADGAISLHAWLFGEDQARYVISVPLAAVDEIVAMASDANVPISQIGTVKGSSISFPGADIEVDALRSAHEKWMPEYMAV